MNSACPRPDYNSILTKRIDVEQESDGLLDVREEEIVDQDQELVDRGTGAGFEAPRDETVGQVYEKGAAAAEGEQAERGDGDEAMREDGWQRGER